MIKKNSVNKSRAERGLKTEIENSGAFIKINKFFAQIGKLGEKVLFKNYIYKLENLVSANREYKNSNLNVWSFIGFKFSLSVLFFILCIILIKSSFLMIPFSITGLAMGFLLPDYLISNMNIRRLQKIDKELPNVIDLLYVSSLSGQNIYNSIKIVSEKYNNQISSEFRIFLKQIDFGIGRKEAYINMLHKNTSDSFKSFIFTLQQAENYGSSISELLKQKAEFLRFEMSQAIEKKTRLISTKMLFPLIFLILPSFILLVCAPLVFMLGADIF
ncbi:MAG: type II secretion system F family protein [Candidatus Humimicrobiaceae bacterium]